MSNSVMYGLYLAVANILFSLITYYTGIWREFMFWGLPVLLVFMIVAVVMAIKDRRASEGEGYLRYGQAYSTGFTTIIIGSLVIVLFSYVYTEYINLDFNQALKEYQVSWMPESMPEAEKQKILDQEPNPVGGAIGQFIMLTIIGSIIVAITAAFLKKNPEPTVMS